MATDLPCGTGLPPESQEAADEAEERPMRHNDLQLQELLRLARSCLKYDRVPGELNARGFFDKFDAELSENSKGQSQDNLPEKATDFINAATLSMEDTMDATLDHLGKLQKVVKTKSFSEIIERSMNGANEAAGLTPLSSNEAEPDARTLRNQTAQLERFVAEAHKALEACTAELNFDVVKQLQLEQEEKAVETELQRAQRQLMLAKDSVRRQNGEIRSFHTYIKELKVAASSVQSAPATFVSPQPPATGPRAGPSRPAGRPLSQSGAPPSPSVATAEAFTESVGSNGASEQHTGTGGAGERPAKQVQQPRTPNLANSIVLPPKLRTYQSVLSSRPKDGVHTQGDMWKLYIP